MEAGELEDPYHELLEGLQALACLARDEDGKVFGHMSLGGHDPL